jgi:hypothetical protein
MSVAATLCSAVYQVRIIPGASTARAGGGFRPVYGNGAGDTPGVNDHAGEHLV